MNLLADHSLTKEDKSTIITLGSIAQAEKKKDPTVVNATIGMLYDELGKLFTFQSVDQALSLLTPEQKYAYSSTPGNQDFHEAVKKWVFRESYDELMQHLHCSVIATPGGSGAISNTFSNYLNPNDVVLLPEYMWGNYKQFAYESFASFTTYSMFDGNQFNLTSVQEKIKEVKQSQHRVVLVINDPCHNPTGYTMKYFEWENLIHIINDATQDQTPFVLLYDLAYIDYDKRGLDVTRKNLLLFKNLNPSVLTILAYSGSKSLALYGLRVGAQIALSKDQQVIKEFFSANQFSSRAKWSTTTNLGMNLVSKVLLQEDLRKKYEEELMNSAAMLTKRAEVFLEECERVHLATLPFVSGFFITIPCSHPKKVYQYLVERKIHIIPLDGVLRITIAAISLKECKQLPSEIKRAISVFE